MSKFSLEASRWSVETSPPSVSFTPINFNKRSNKKRMQRSVSCMDGGIAMAASFDPGFRGSLSVERVNDSTGADFSFLC